MPPSKFFTKSQRGSALVSLIIAMTIIATLGAAMLSSNTNAVFTQIGSIDSSKGYYLAEGGKRYAMNFIQADIKSGTSSPASVTTLNGKTFNLAGGAGQFKIALSANTSSDPHVFTLTVTGIPNSGTERPVTYTIKGGICFGTS